MTPEQETLLFSRLEALEAENKTLKDRVDAQDGYASGIPQDLRAGDPLVGGVGYDQYARHVTVATRASEEYSSWSGKPVIDAGVLVRNSKSNPVEG